MVEDWPLVVHRQAALPGLAPDQGAVMQSLYNLSVLPLEPIYPLTGAVV